MIDLIHKQLIYTNYLFGIMPRKSLLEIRKLVNMRQSGYLHATLIILNNEFATQFKCKKYVYDDMYDAIRRLLNYVKKHNFIYGINSEMILRHFFKNKLPDVHNNILAELEIINKSVANYLKENENHINK